MHVNMCCGRAGHTRAPHTHPLPQADPWNSTAADLTAKMMGVLGDAATQARAAAVGAQLRLETGAATAARLILQFVHDTPAAAASGTPPH